MVTDNFHNAPVGINDLMSFYLIMKLDHEKVEEENHPINNNFNVCFPTSNPCTNQFRQRFSSAGLEFKINPEFL